MRRYALYRVPILVINDLHTRSFWLLSDVSEDSGAKSPFPLRNELKPGGRPVIPPIDYEEDPLGHDGETQHSAELSEDTDCDGSSLPEDSPEVQI
ncbi:hypothetical protein EYF80_036423 [Liparis tanakae]|uniref:Uncharacterized protein n=1 Tax=Liparis tanakae TaxID=230148 RepID=A0A4Z2GIS7_9TELE|nr:hypothetical protein EYF80_036423 [Liparis tanakae]